MKGCDLVLSVGKNRTADRIGLNSTTGASVSGNIEMQDFDGPKAPTRVRTVPVVMVVMAATMIGATLGILLADRNVWLSLRKEISSQFAAVRGSLFASADPVSAKPETPQVIPTGLSSIVAIYYSSKSDFAHMAFDLKAVDLVGTGKLRTPDRIYFDLQDRSREQSTFRRLKTQKAVSIAGNLLTGVRISQRKPGATRIVLDLKRSCDFTYQTSPGPPSRLMVEIRPRPTG
jgi:hypothetical protein